MSTSESTSGKELVVRKAAGALEVARTQGKRKKLPKKALDEDEFTDVSSIRHNDNYSSQEIESNHDFSPPTGSVTHHPERLLSRHTQAPGSDGVHRSH